MLHGLHHDLVHHQRGQVSEDGQGTCHVFRWVFLELENHVPGWVNASAGVFQVHKVAGALSVGIRCFSLWKSWA